MPEQNLLDVNKIRYIIENEHYRPIDIENSTNITTGLTYRYRMLGANIENMSLRIAKDFVFYFDKVSNNPLTDYEEDILDISKVPKVINSSKYSAWDIQHRVNISRQQISKYRKQDSKLQSMTIGTIRKIIEYYDIMNPLDA